MLSLEFGRVLRTPLVTPVQVYPPRILLATEPLPPEFVREKMFVRFRDVII
jgi:hypothetical protein